MRKGVIFKLVVTVLGISIGGCALFGDFSVFNFNFNISLQENHVQHSVDTNTLENTSNKNSKTIAKKSEDEENSKEIPKEIKVSFKDYIGKWNLPFYSYNARKTYSEIEVKNVRKEEIYALTIDLFLFEDDELGKNRSCKLALAEDGILYANFTENGSYDYNQTVCKQ